MGEYELYRRKGQAKAKQLHEYLGLQYPWNITLEELVEGRGALLKEDIIDGADGRILFHGAQSIITINSAITLNSRRRFVLAHEFGHFEMHSDLGTDFADNTETLQDWYQHGPHEIEANGYAAELLMPEKYFKEASKGKFTLKIISEVAHRFQTSMTSSLIRYKELGDFPVAIISIENKKIKWSQFSPDFVLQFIPNGSPVPMNTVAHDVCCRGMEVPKQPESVDAMDWFAQDFNIEDYQRWKFSEQCFKVSESGLITCLWGK